MRIIAGNFKGKKLFLPKNRLIRPLRDLVKESIFNIIQHSHDFKTPIDNSIVLDLFAGSGSFGIECISRGAKKVYFFEKNFDAIKILKKNINSLNHQSQYKIIEQDCFIFFKKIKKFETKCDIIFIDPPYQEPEINSIVNDIVKKKILNKDGVLIIHRHKSDKITLTNNLKIFKISKYGISNIFFATNS